MNNSWPLNNTGLNCMGPLTHGFLSNNLCIQLTGAVQTVLFKGQLQSWESAPGTPYAEGRTKLYVDF